MLNTQATLNKIKRLKSSDWENDTPVIWLHERLVYVLDNIFWQLNRSFDKFDISSSIRYRTHKKHFEKYQNVLLAFNQANNRDMESDIEVSLGIEIPEISISISRNYDGLIKFYTTHDGSGYISDNDDGVSIDIKFKDFDDPYHSLLQDTNRILIQDIVVPIMDNTKRLSHLDLAYFLVE